MGGSTACITSAFPISLCLGGYQWNGGVPGGVLSGGQNDSIHQRATPFRTKLTPRLKTSKARGLVLTSATKSAESLKPVPNFNGLEIIRSKIFVKNKGSHLVKEPIHKDDHLLEGPSQSEILKQLELQHSLAGQDMSIDVAEKRKIDTPAKKRSLHSTMFAHFCDALERAMIRAVYPSSERASEEPGNYFLLGNYAPVEEFGPACCVSIHGYLHECLNGEFVRIGPNPKYSPVAKYHWLDGDGMLHGLRIKDGEVTYASRYVKTSRFQQEEYWGGPKFFMVRVKPEWTMRIPNLIDRIGDLIRQEGLAFVALFVLRLALGVVNVSNGHGTANTALTYHNGKLLALCESDKPYLVQIHDDGDIETIGRYDYDKKLNHAFTAHPKIDPDTGEMFTFGYGTGAHPNVTYRVISKDGVIGDPVRITRSGSFMMHDFAITENYAIFMDCPLYFSPMNMVLRNQNPIAFDETKPARLGVLPRYAKNESQIRWFEVSTCVIYHTANAWEEGDEVIVNSCRSPSLDLESISEYDKDKEFIHHLWEYRLNLKTGEAVERQLGEFPTDFPTINEEYVGRKNKFVYTTVFEDVAHPTGIAKYDLTLEPDLGKEKLEVGGNVAGVFWFGNQRFGSEAVYVPKRPGREAEEDDGYLLCFVFDEKTWESEVLVIDARTMSPEPVAVIELPTRVPYGFHAMFVNEDKLRLQKS